MIKEIEIKDWQHFTSLAEKLSSGGSEGPIIFRGQPDVKWHLTPSLTRVIKSKNLNQKQGLFLEKKALESFQRQAHLAAEFCKDLNPADPLLWWEYMQHYNAPTRLLDWSKSPYVALYYSVEDLSGKDSALFTFDAGHLTFVKTVRSRNDDTHWVTHNFQQLTKSLSSAEYEKTIMVVSCPKPTDRMVAQQSSFTVCTEILSDHDVFADQMVFTGVHGGEGQSIVQKYIVSSRLKPKFLTNLKRMDITANTLFPGIDGLGRSIRELLGMRAERMKKKT